MSNLVDGIERANAANYAGIDHLGRSLVSYEEAGPLKPDKQVGLFYYLWHGAHGTEGPYDVTKIEQQDPQALDHPDSPLWPNPLFPPMFHWGEPLWGYYLSDDEWVLRRQIQLFIDAGIDLLYFDTTNYYHYRDCTEKLFPILAELRSRGIAAPKFCYYMAPEPNVLGAANVINVWNEYYKTGRFRECWFEWEGKPLMCAHPDRPYPQEVRDFFTWRKPTWGSGGVNTWSWWAIEQDVSYSDRGRPEMMAVTVGSPAFPPELRSQWDDAMAEKFLYHGCSEAHFGRPTQSRSWHDGKLDTRENAAHYGLHFQDQIDWALDPKRADVPVAFICQWNEWLMPFRTKKMSGWENIKHWLLFMDEYNMENSRDIEPMNGGYMDAYYFQMMNFVRRFKGLPPPAKATHQYAIALDGDFSEWDAVSPVYVEMTGDCAPRDHRGYDAAGIYRNYTGRNEFRRLKIATDGVTVFFYAETVKALTHSTDRNWMNLFIKVPGGKTDAMGYTHRIDVTTPGVKCVHRDNQLVYAVPAVMLGIDATKSFRLEFKWSDNRQRDDVMDFYVNGDAAPRGRINWLFIYDKCTSKI